jgi:hypothetical protein
MTSGRPFRAVDRAIAIAFAILILDGCTTASRKATIYDDADVSVSGTELTYHGSITHEANARLFSLVMADGKKPQRLVITSKGGEIGAGMELGNWVFDEGLDVYVPEYCVSSCANYVFTAGRRKFLNDTAMLFWHGGALQEQLHHGPLCDAVRELTANVECDEEQQRKSFSRQLAAYREDEAAFFSKIKVDQQITVLGQRPEYECQGNYLGWYYSIQDLNAMGVDDIVVYGAAWNPVPLSAEIRICQVKPDHSPGEALR